MAVMNPDSLKKNRMAECKKLEVFLLGVLKDHDVDSVPLYLNLNRMRKIGTQVQTWHLCADGRRFKQRLQVEQLW